MTLYTIGLGCRRGSSVAEITAAIHAALGAHWSAALLPDACDAGPPVSAVVSPTAPPRHRLADPGARACVQVATLDAKGTEPGLLAYCMRHRLPLRLFSRDALAQVTVDAGVANGTHGTDVSPPSDAVRARFGVDGVCEPAALCASPRGVLLVRKTSLHGVSIALAGPAATNPAAASPNPLTGDRR